MVIILIEIYITIYYCDLKIAIFFAWLMLFDGAAALLLLQFRVLSFDCPEPPFEQSLYYFHHALLLILAILGLILAILSFMLAILDSILSLILTNFRLLGGLPPEWLTGA